MTANEFEVGGDTVTTTANLLSKLQAHSSQDPTPSREDIEVTKRLMEAGKVLGIDVLKKNGTELYA